MISLTFTFTIFTYFLIFLYNIIFPRKTKTAFIVIYFHKSDGVLININMHNIQVFCFKNNFH